MNEYNQEAYLACYSECTNPTIFQFAVTQLKDKLLEDRKLKTNFVYKQVFCCFCSLKDARQEWKEGRGIMGTMAPKFQKEPDLSTLTTPRPPSLRLCKMTPSGHLEIPRDVRQKWLNDPVRSVSDKKMKSSLAVFPCFSPFHTGYVVFNMCFSSSFFVGSFATSTKTLIGVCGWRISIQFLLQLLVMQKLQHHSPSRKMLKGICHMMQLAFQLQQLHLFVNHPPWPKVSSSLNLLAKSQLWWHWAWVLGKLSHAIWWTTRSSWVQAPTLEYLEQPPRTHDPCSCMQEAHGSQIRPRWGFPIWSFSSPNLIWSNCCHLGFQIWVSSCQQAKDYLSKPANENKAVEFKIHGPDELDSQLWTVHCVFSVEAFLVLVFLICKPNKRYFQTS